MAEKPEARWRLTNLKLRKIDRVGAGDNPAARVLLAKAAGKPGFGHEYVSGGPTGTCKVCGRSHDQGDMDRRRTRTGSLGFPTKTRTVGTTKEDRMPEIDLTALPDDVKAAFTDLQGKLTTAETALAAAAQAPTVAAELETAKATIARFEGEKAAFEKAAGVRPAIKREDLPEDVRKALDQADADRAESTALKDRVAKMERDTRRATLVAKAAAEYPNVPGTPEELADLLVEVTEKLEGETAKRLEAMLKAANAQIDASKLFGQIGGHGMAADVRKEFDAAVDKAKAAGLNRGDAVAKVLHDHPEYATDLKV